MVHASPYWVGLVEKRTKTALTVPRPPVLSVALIRPAGLGAGEAADLRADEGAAVDLGAAARSPLLCRSVR